MSGGIGQEHTPARRTIGRTVSSEGRGEEGSGRQDGVGGRGRDGHMGRYLDHVEITYMMIVCVLIHV